MQTLLRTMRAVLLKGNGGFDQLEHRDGVPAPTPMEGGALIRVGAGGINNTDTNTRTAWYSKRVREGTASAGASHGFVDANSENSGWTGATPAFPRIQGADACGVIVAVGPGVDAKRVGHRVLAEPVFRDPL